MSNTDSDFGEFMRRRQESSRAYVQGDATPLDKIVARVHPATFFPPTGGCVEGTLEVASKYERDAQAFEQGGDFSFEVLQTAAADEVAYWVGLMRGTARMRGQPGSIPMHLRVTEVFRRENSYWKLVHRHADPMAEATN